MPDPGRGPNRHSHRQTVASRFSSKGSTKSTEPKKHQSLQSDTLLSAPSVQDRVRSAPPAPKSDSPAKTKPVDDAVAETELPRDSISNDPFFKQYTTPQQQRIASILQEQSQTGGNGGHSRNRGGEEDVSVETAAQLEQSRQPMGAINISIIGAHGVGKSSFVQQVFERVDGDAAHDTRMIKVGDDSLVVKLFELSINDLRISDRGQVLWPNQKNDTPIPHIDGVIALYDVMDPNSLPPVRKFLEPLTKSGVPICLASSKRANSDAPPKIDSDVVAQKARTIVHNITVAEITQEQPKSHQRCLDALLSEVTVTRPGADQHGLRRRAATSDWKRAEPSESLRHARARSDLSGSYSINNEPPVPPMRSQEQTEYDPGHQQEQDNRTLAALAVPKTPPPKLSSRRQDLTIETGLAVPQSIRQRSPRSFLDLEESPGPEKVSFSGTGIPRDDFENAEAGVTFDELVARLLAKSDSKKDQKFNFVFLAFYRMFAPPLQLLEAIISQFQVTNRSRPGAKVDSSFHNRTLMIFDRWINAYPGDFAHPSTRQKLKKFLSETEWTGTASATAQQTGFALTQVVADDDTDWAYQDEDMPTSIPRARANTFLSTSSVESYDDDSDGEAMLKQPEPFQKVPAITPEQDSKLIFGGDSTLTLTAMGPDSNSSSQTILNVAETAQRQARDLEPKPTMPLTKAAWRQFMEHPDELVARELTRIDWIMFTSIRPRDLLRHVTIPVSERHEFPALQNVTRMIDHFNHLAYWVTNMVLLRDKPKHRAQALEKMMRIGRELRKLNNYNALGAVVAGVQGSSVHRLGATKALLDPKVARDWMKLEILMSTTKSHEAYRLAWENSTGGRVPFLPLHRRDLVVTDSGNRTFVSPPTPASQPVRASQPPPATGSSSTRPPLDRSASDSTQTPPPPPKINWRKFQVMGDALTSIQNALATPYAGFAPNAEAQTLVLCYDLLKDDDELHERSMAIEPSGGGAGALTPALAVAAGSSTASSEAGKGTNGGVGARDGAASGVRRKFGLGKRS